MVEASEGRKKGLLKIRYFRKHTSKQRDDSKDGEEGEEAELIRLRNWLDTGNRTWKIILCYK